MIHTLKNFYADLVRIKEAINSITVKGEQNASYVVYANGKCNDLIGEVQKLIRNEENGQKIQNGQEEMTTDGR